MALNINSAIGDPNQLKTGGGKTVQSILNKGFDTSKMEDIFSGIGKGAGLDPKKGVEALTTKLDNLKKSVDLSQLTKGLSVDSLTKEVEKNAQSLTNKLTENLGIQNSVKNIPEQIENTLKKTVTGLDKNVSIKNNLTQLTSQIKSKLKTDDLLGQLEKEGKKQFNDLVQKNVKPITTSLNKIKSEVTNVSSKSQNTLKDSLNTSKYTNLLNSKLKELTKI